MSEIRVITASDIPGAMRLKEAAGWNQTEQDWRNLLSLEPEGCFGIDCDGELAATTTAVRYGRELAWIGMVLTAPEYRGRGFARALMEHALGWLDAAGVDWVKLDATDMGRPLYARLGFEDECVIERWGRQPADAPSGPGCDVRTSRELDRCAFGADRSALLDMLESQGCGTGRAGSKAAYFGPCVTDSPEVARQAAGAFLTRHARGNVYWDILETNPDAARIARDLGFSPLRRLIRMARRGTPSFTHQDRYVYAIAGFEYG